MLTKPSRFLKIMWLPEYNILDKKAQWITITSMWAHVIRQKQSLWNVQQHSNKIKIQNQVSGASSLRPNPVSQEKGESQIQGPQKAKSTCLNVTLITLFFISINTKPNWLCFPLSLKSFFCSKFWRKIYNKKKKWRPFNPGFLTTSSLALVSCNNTHIFQLLPINWWLRLVNMSVYIC